VAVASAGEPDQMEEVFTQAVTHRGFSFVHIYSPCLTFDKKLSYDFLRTTLKPLPSNHDASSLEKAVGVALSGGFRTGVYYRVRRKTFDERMEDIREKALKTGPSDFEKLFL